jgi:replicative DNA helicase
MAVPAFRAALNAAKVGDPLPHVEALQDLYEEGTEIYRGAVTMVAGMPGAMKTLFSLWYASELNIPTLYFSADSDAATMTSRMASAITQVDSISIRNDYKDDDQRAYYAERLAESRIDFCFDSSPGIGDMVDEIDAYVTLYGEYPELIVVDNLMDVYSDSDNEFSGNKSTLRELKELARETGSALIVLHHMSEADTDSATPAPRSKLMGKVAQTPALVLSLAVEGTIFKIAVVKNRNGKSTPNALDYVALRVDPARATFQRSQWRAAPTYGGM